MTFRIRRIPQDSKIVCCLLLPLPSTRISNFVTCDVQSSEFRRSDVQSFIIVKKVLLLLHTLLTVLLF